MVTLAPEVRTAVFETSPGRTNDEADKRRVLVERVFSPFSSEQLGGLTLDDLKIYADRMHATLRGLQPQNQRLPGVFSAIEAELDEVVRTTLNSTWPELGDASPWAILTRIARGETNFSFTLGSNDADED